jgi:hypothetical protein
VDPTRAWEAEYRAGRYVGEPPLPFVADILAAARAHGHHDGIYVGCGNGRNYVPLVDGGLDLIGLDISATALEQLAERLPRARLVHGTLDALPPAATYPVVVGIQVFQHGDRATAHAHIEAAQQRVQPGGLFCLRVNAAGTDVRTDHETVEHGPDGGFTVRYLAGAKRGLLIHFFGTAELRAMFARDFDTVLAPRLVRTWRTEGRDRGAEGRDRGAEGRDRGLEERDRRTGRTAGQWSQWEAIWRRR